MQGSDFSEAVRGATNAGGGFAQRLAAVESRIQAACEAAGRAREQVQLLAVSKFFPAEALAEAHAHGLRSFGESYIQEFAEKAAAVRQLAGVRVHLIGHLQSNKSRRAAELFDCIHTVDSLKLLRRLDEQRGELGLSPLEIFLEVKLSSEESKQGAAPAEVPELVAAARQAKNLQLRGLMTMPPLADAAEEARPYFRQLREMAEREGLQELSMGMSDDLEVAIAEGATMVRVGTALFGRRQ